MTSSLSLPDVALEWFELELSEAFTLGFASSGDAPSARYFTDASDVVLIAEHVYPAVDGVLVPAVDVDPAVHTHGGRKILEARHTPKRVYWTIEGHSHAHPVHRWFSRKDALMRVSPHVEPMWRYRLLRLNPSGQVDVFGAPEPGTKLDRISKLLRFDLDWIAILSPVDESGYGRALDRPEFRLRPSAWVPAGWEA